MINGTVLSPRVVITRLQPDAMPKLFSNKKKNNRNKSTATLMLWTVCKDEH